MVLVGEEPRMGRLYRSDTTGSQKLVVNSAYVVFRRVSEDTESPKILLYKILNQKYLVIPS